MAVMPQTFDAALQDILRYFSSSHSGGRPSRRFSAISGELKPCLLENVFPM
jgi:hypothetical protein